MLGTALVTLVARELEGALALFIVAGLQFVADPETALAHVLPFWSARELATYAVDGDGSAGAALLHAAVTLAVLGAVAAVAVAAVASAVRERRHSAGHAVR